MTFIYTFFIFSKILKHMNRKRPYQVTLDWDSDDPQRRPTIHAKITTMTRNLVNRRRRVIQVPRAVVVDDDDDDNFIDNTANSKTCCSSAKQAIIKHWMWTFYPCMDVYKIPTDLCPIHLCPGDVIALSSTENHMLSHTSNYPFKNLLINETHISDNNVKGIYKLYFYILQICKNFRVVQPCRDDALKNRAL